VLHKPEQKERGCRLLGLVRIGGLLFFLFLPILLCSLSLAQKLIRNFLKEPNTIRKMRDEYKYKHLDYIFCFLLLSEKLKSFLFQNFLLLFLFLLMTRNFLFSETLALLFSQNLWTRSKKGKTNLDSLQAYFVCKPPFGYCTLPSVPWQSVRRDEIVLKQITSEKISKGDENFNCY